MERDVIINVRSDASQADKSAKTLEDRFKDLNKQVESGEMSMREYSKAIKEYQTIALQAGKDSPIGKQAIQNAASLTDEIGDLRKEVQNLAHDGNAMQGAMQLGSTIISGYTAMKSVTALMGIENEKLMQTLVKLQAATALLVSIEQIRAALEKESFLMQNLRIVQTKAATLANYAYATAVGTATGALKAFRLALLGLGLVGIAAGITAVIIKLSSLSDGLKQARKDQQELNKVMNEAVSSTTDLRTKVIEMKSAFELAKKGVLDKDKALQQYNENFGEALGIATDLNDAERIFAEKTDAYIKATMLRAQANALAAKAAEEMVKQIAPPEEKVVSTWEKIGFGIKTQIFGIQSATTSLANSALTNLQSLQDEADRMAGVYTTKSQELLAEALRIENEYQIGSNSQAVKNKTTLIKELRNLDDELAAMIEKDRLKEEEKFFEALRKRQEEESKVKEEYRQRQLNEEEKAFDQLKLRYQSELEAARDNEELKLQLRLEYENATYELEKKFSDARKKLEQDEIDELNKIAQQELEFKLSLAAQGFEAVGNFADLLTARTDKNARAAFTIKKVAAVSEAVVDGRKAVLSAYASTPPPFNIAAAIGAGVFSASQIARIVSQQYGGGAASGFSTSIPTVTPQSLGQSGSGISNTNTTSTNINDLIGGGQTTQSVLVVDSFNKVANLQAKTANLGVI